MVSINKVCKHPLILFAFVGFITDVYATDNKESDWTMTIGAAGIYSPTFQGSKSYNFSIVPDLRFNYRNDFFASVPEGIGYNIINRPKGQSGWKIGPIAKIKFERDEDDGKNIFSVWGNGNNLNGMGDVDTAFEFGGFIDYQWNKIQARIEPRRGFGGHNGIIINAKVNYNDNAGPLRFSFGPRLTWANREYNQTYFGVNNIQSANSGLEVYYPGDGLVSYGFGVFAMMPITYSLVVNVFSGYDLLGIQAKDSSFIKKYGLENQFSLGVGFSYRFEL